MCLTVSPPVWVVRWLRLEIVGGTIQPFGGMPTPAGQRAGRESLIIHSRGPVLSRGARDTGLILRSRAAEWFSLGAFNHRLCKTCRRVVIGAKGRTGKSGPASTKASLAWVLSRRRRVAGTTLAVVTASKWPGRYLAR